MSKNIVKVSIVIPMRNSSSTILKTLEGIRIQTYPIEKIVIVDNASKDDCVLKVKEYSKKHKKMKITLLQNKTDLWIAKSFTRGIHATQTPYVILTHSDCEFVTRHEVMKLVRPLLKDRNIIATCGMTETPLTVWNEYAFWEKAWLCRDAGKVITSFVGKIECIQQKALYEVGGHDNVAFKDCGCEDADLNLRLRKLGPIVETKAKTIHLHYTYKDFSLKDLLYKKKQVGRGYARLLRVHGFDQIGGIRGLSFIALKPALALVPFIPLVNIISPILLFGFVFLYYKEIFTTKSTLRDPRILLLPFVGIFLIYYETAWFIKMYLEPIKK